MSRTSIQEINRMGKRLAKKCINESRRRALVESDNWRDNHMTGTADNNKAYEEWARKMVMMGMPAEYIQAVGELNSWVGGGAESNGLFDWSSGNPVLRQDAYAEFANGDNNWFKRNNAPERNAWFNERADIISQVENALSGANPYGGMPSYGGMPPYIPYGGMPPYGYPPMAPPPPPPYGGGQGGNNNSLDLAKLYLLSDMMRTQGVGRREAEAHPECAAGTCKHSSHQGKTAPTMNPILPFMLLSGGSGRPSQPPMPSFGRPPMGGGYNRLNPALFGGGMNRRIY